MSLRQFAGNSILGLLPPTRAYVLKRLLLRGMGVKLGANVRCASSVRIYGQVEITLGDDVFIGHDVRLAGGRSRVTIGDCVDIAPRVSILTGTHEIDMLGAHSAGRGYSHDIRIEDGVWIGAGSTILAGVTIGRKAVIAAGSTVTHDIPPYTLAAGTPCRPKKTWSRETGQWIPAYSAEVKAA